MMPPQSVQFGHALDHVGGNEFVVPANFPTAAQRTVKRDGADGDVDLADNQIVLLQHQELGGIEHAGEVGAAGFVLCSRQLNRSLAGDDRVGQEHGLGLGLDEGRDGVGDILLGGEHGVLIGGDRFFEAQHPARERCW